MSIIYDALKKIEQRKKREVPPSSPAPSGNISKVAVEKKPSSALRYLAAAGLLCISLAVLFNSLSSLFGRNLKARGPAMSVSPPQGKGAFDNKTPAGMVSGLAQKIIASSIAPQTAGGALNLNGIFYSDEGSYALVNNKIVKEGDVIEGWLVTRIGIGEVELKSNDLTIKLNKIK